MRDSRRLEVTSTLVLAASVMFALAGAVRFGCVRYDTSRGPALQTHEAHFDFGRIARSRSAYAHHFVLSNVTDAPVNVTAVQVDCGSCMHVDWSTRVIAPGEVVELKVSLLTSTLAGQVAKRVRVYCAGTETPVVLTLVADVL